jgi:hypothetical protein
MIINEFQAGIITRDEARAKRNLPPLGDNQPADQPAPDGETADA